MDHTDNGVQSVDRTLDILEAISTEQKGLGITDIAGRVGLSKSTVHRLTNALAARGYLEKTEDSTYKVGLKLIEVVSCYINSLELQTEARPYLRELTSTLNLTSHLGVLDGFQVVYVEKMDMFSGVRLYSQIGFRMPAYCSSLGKCLLSKLSSHELESVMADCNYDKFTPNTITNTKDLKEHLVEVRKKGWAMDNQEHDIGHRCIGAPIYDYRGEIIAAISASGPITLLNDDKIEPTATVIKKVAADLSRSLGYSIS